MFKRSHIEIFSKSDFFFFSSKIQYLPKHLQETGSLSEAAELGMTEVSCVVALPVVSTCSQLTIQAIIEHMPWSELPAWEENERCLYGVFRVFQTALDEVRIACPRGSHGVDLRILRVPETMLTPLVCGTVLASAQLEQKPRWVKLPSSREAGQR